MCPEGAWPYEQFNAQNKKQAARQIASGFFAFFHICFFGAARDHRCIYLYGPNGQNG